MDGGSAVSSGMLPGFRGIAVNVTKEELDQFHDFAVSVVCNAESDVTWLQLFELWCREHPSGGEYQQNVAAIGESLHAMEAGRMRPFSAFDADFRTRHGITSGK